MVQWLRYSVQTVATATVILPQRGLAVLHTQHGKLQLLRALLMITCTSLGFLSLRYVPVGDFTAIVSLVPLMVTLASIWLLKEKVSALRWALALGSFGGVLLIVHPGRDNFSLTWLLPLLLVITACTFQLLTAKLMRTESAATTHLYSGLFGMCITTIALPFVWQSLPLSVWGLMCIVAVASSIGHVMHIKAFQYLPAAQVSVYQYTQIGFAMLGGWLVFARIPDALALGGITLIALCGVLSAWLTLREGKTMVASQGLET